MAPAVPLSRFAPQVGGGSAFYVRRMRASAKFRFLLPLFIGTVAGVFFTIIFLISPTYAMVPSWNAIAPIIVFLHHPAKLMMGLWLARFPNFPVVGCIICTTLAQWLLVGLLAGLAWAYFGRTHEKTST